MTTTSHCIGIQIRCLLWVLPSGTQRGCFPRDFMCGSSSLVQAGGEWNPLGRKPRNVFCQKRNKIFYMSSATDRQIYRSVDALAWCVIFDSSLAKTGDFYRDESEKVLWYIGLWCYDATYTLRTLSQGNLHRWTTFKSRNAAPLVVHWYHFPYKVWINVLTRKPLDM